MNRLFAFALMAMTLVLPATASAGVTPLNPADGGTADTVAEAIEVVPGEITGADLPEYSYDEMEDGVSPIGVGDTSPTPPTGLAGFPTQGSSFGILSSGDVTEIGAQLTNEDEETGFPFSDQFAAVDRGPGAEEWTVMKVDFNVPAGANCLALDYRFLSEEFPEYVNSQYNDAFIAELDTTTWRAGEEGALSRPNDFAASPAGAAISVNGIGPFAVDPGQAAGTYFDAATALITTKTPVTPGPHSINLSIFDSGDKSVDSAVLFDNLRFFAEDPSTCRPPTEAELDAPGTNPLPPLPLPPPSNAFSASPKVKFNAGGTKVTLTVNVPGPGNLSVGQPSGAGASALRNDLARASAKKKLKKPAKLIVPTSVRAAAAGQVKITVGLTGAAKAYLAKKGTLPVSIQLTFTPDGGTAASQVQKVTFKKKKCAKGCKGKK
jgi:hypothetical protein